jgi:hypothetical protein
MEGRFHVAIFRISGNVNHHNMRIQGEENPYAIDEHMQGSPKIAFFALSKSKIYS